MLGKLYRRGCRDTRERDKYLGREICWLRLLGLFERESGLIFYGVMVESEGWGLCLGGGVG